jgi:chromosome segregation ATPase
MAITSEILDAGAVLKEISTKNFDAGDKVLALWNGVRITLDSTRDEHRKTLKQRDALVSEQTRELSVLAKKLEVIENRAAIREAEFTRQSNDLSELAGNYAKASISLQEITAFADLTVEQKAKVEEAAAEADRSFKATIEAKDALMAEEVKSKLDALDQVAKLGTDVADLSASLSAERAEREMMLAKHDRENDEILAMIKDLTVAQQEEDKDLRDASASYEGGYES